MSNKTQLSTNNAKLDTLTSLTSSMRDKVATLPDAGGGGNIESCTVTMAGKTPSLIGCMSFINGAMIPACPHPGDASFTVVKNSLFVVVVSSGRYMPSASGNASLLSSAATAYIYNITGDATITIS